MADLLSLTIDHSPNKTTYFVGDRFERYGMVVKAHYDDGSSSTIDFYMCSPIDPLTINDTQITISFMDKSVTQSITVINPHSAGYFINKCLDKANYGNNPYVNTVDASISFYNSPITIERDSYQLNVILSYHSRMSDKESDLIKGFYKGFRTNYHQFLIKDGKDNDNNDIYKYIDGSGYIHTFLYNEETSFYHDKEGRYLILNLTNRTITDSKDNVYTFDTSGRLISIQSGLNLLDIKVIEYNSDGIRKIYDNRNPNVYIKFSYNFSFLVYIRAYYNDDNNPLKTYTFNGMFGQITSISESVGNNTRTLYEYLYNDREKVRRIVDHLNNVAYRLTYDFDTVLNDYRFNSIRQGYMSNDSLIEQKGIYFVRRNVNTIDPYKPIYELVIEDDNDIDTSFMSDTNGEPVSVFESNHGYTSTYKTLSKEIGKRLSFQNNISTYGTINGKKAKLLSSTLTIDEGLSSTDLDSSEYVKLCGYIKIRADVQRAKLWLDGTNVSTEYIDLNPSAYYVWQYFEIPFIRTKSNNVPLSFASFNLETRDEDDDNFNAAICNLRFVKCEARQRLFFLNCNSSIALDEIKSVILYKGNNTYETINVLDYSLYYMSQNDLLMTIKENHRHPNNTSFWAYFNNGKIIKKYVSPDITGVSLDDRELYLLDEQIVNNDTLGSNKNWFFATLETAPNKTYYRFKQNYYEVIIRNEITDYNNQTKYIDDISKYNYQDQLLENRKTHYNDSFVASITTTTYEYFTDGQLKKVYQTNGNETIVLYEATSDSSGRIIRITSGLQSVGISYNNYLESVITKNSVNGASITNSLYSKQISYDGYLQDITSIAFKYNNQNQTTNIVSKSDDRLSTTWLVNNNPIYKIVHDVSNNTTKLKRYDDELFFDILSYKQTPSFDETTFYGNSINEVTLDQYNEHGSLICQKLNNNIKAVLDYENSYESPFIFNMLGVTDYYLDDGGLETSFVYDSIDNSLNQINFNNEFVIDIDSGHNKIEYSFFSSNIQTTGIIVEQLNDKTNVEITYQHSIFEIERSFSIKRDGFDRPIKASYEVYDGNWYLVLFSYQNGSNNPASFSFGISPGTFQQERSNYDETYGYDQNGNLSSISINNVSNSRTYSYDGFNRLIQETNTSDSSFNRTYSYYSDGKMEYFGDKHLTYNDEGQLHYFGDIYFSYDKYGNRQYKNADEYVYERGRLLKQINKSNDFITFKYDYLGRRYKKSSYNGDSVFYYYHDDKLIAEIRNNGANTTKLIFLYHGNEIMGFCKVDQYSEKIYYYIKNPFGLIVGIYNESNALVGSYIYDAWGNHQAVNFHSIDPDDIADLNPIRYKGYYYDKETGLYYLKSRYYDPSIGQFITPDDYNYLSINSISGYHLYAYCNNNPVAYFDSHGNTPDWVYWLAGGLVIAGSIALTIITNGAAWPILTGALTGGVSGGFFGGADFSSGFSWDWSGSAKGFAWGSAGGALSGAVDMGVSSFLSTTGSKGFFYVMPKILVNGFTSLGFSKFEAMVEHEEWTFARAGTTFFLGGLGSLFGRRVISSFAWGIGFSVTEGGLGEFFDYYSLTSLFKNYYPWRRFLCLF